MSEFSSPLPSETPAPMRVEPLDSPDPRSAAEAEAVSSLPICPSPEAPLALRTESQSPAVALSTPEAEAPTTQPTPASVPSPVRAEARSRSTSLLLRLSALGLVCLSSLGIAWMAGRNLATTTALATTNLDFGPDLVQREVTHISLQNLSDLDPYDQPARYTVMLKPRNQRQAIALRRYLPQAQIERRQPQGTLLRVESFRTADAAAEYNRHLRLLGYNVWVEKSS